MTEPIDRGMPDLDALYRDVVLDHYKNPRGRRPLDAPTACHEGENPLCGDQCKLCVEMKDGKVAGVEVQARGCAISTASGSMLAQLLPGKTAAEAAALVRSFKGMMHGEAPPAGVDLGDLESLEGVKMFPVRVKCALLAWTTLEELLRALTGGAPDEPRGETAPIPAPGAAEPPPSTPAPPVTRDVVLDALRPISDPELKIGIVDLGLVYGVEIDPSARRVRVRMTLTTPACPFGPALLDQARSAVRAIPGVEDAAVDLVWEPRWDPRTMASDLAKDQLNIW